MVIEINFKNENLSSFVKKWDKINAKIGPTDKSKPAVFEFTYNSAQLISPNGIKFPINPIINIEIILFKLKLKLSFLMLKYKNKINAPIISLIAATEIGWIVSILILIAKKADPHIADNKINNRRFFKEKLVDR